MSPSFDGASGEPHSGHADGHDEGPLGAVAKLHDRPEHLGNDVSRLADDDGVADQDALRLDDVLVVERRLPHDAARHARRLHDGERGRPAGAADRDDDVEQLRVDLLGRVLVGDRPARRAARGAQLVVQRELVDLDDHAVDLVLDVVPVLAVVPDELIGTGRRVRDPEVGARREPPRREQGIDLALRRHRRVGPGADPVHGQAQPREPFVHGLQLALVLALGLLPQGSGCRVPRVREEPVARLLLVGVERLEVGDVEEHLAAHFHQVGMALTREHERDAVQPPHVLGDVFADAAVAAGGRGHQSPALVAERQREPVDLELAQEVHRPAGVALHLRGPGQQLLVAEDVVEAQHPLGVLHRGEEGAGGRPDAQRRRVLPLQLRDAAVRGLRAGASSRRRSRRRRARHPARNRRRARR